MKKFFLLFTYLAIHLYTQAQTSSFDGGYFYSVYLSENGGIYTVGDNTRFQLGKDNPSMDPNLEMMDRAIYPKLHTINSGGGHNLAIACDGSVWAWGANGSCQLGNGLTHDMNGNPCTDPTGGNPGYCDSPTPYQVVGGETGEAYLQDVVAIDANVTNSYAITSDQRLLAWGGNDKNQLGNGSSISKEAAPVYVLNPEGTSPLENAIAIAATDYGSYVLIDDNNDGVGTVYGWGTNENKQFGEGASTITLPQPIINDDGEILDNITMIAAGSTHGLFLDEDGYLWAIGGVWGGGNQLGTTDATYSPTPELARKVLAGEQKHEIAEFENEPYLANVKQIAAGQAHSLAIVEYNNTRYLMAWGSNSIDPWKGGTATGMLGNGTNVSANVPQFVLNEDGTDFFKNVQSIACGKHHNMATTFDYLTNEEQMYAWGGNYFGQIGDGTTTNAQLPVRINEPNLEPKAPCPVAELGPDKLIVCSSELNMDEGKMIRLHPGSFGNDYVYEWDVIMYINGQVIALSQDMIEKLTAIDQNGEYINIGFEADVSVSITKTTSNELSCNDCPVAYDKISIRLAEPTFTTKRDSFCGTEAPITLYTPKGNNYSIYAEAEGGTPLGSKTTAGEDITFYAPIGDMEKLTYNQAGELYVEDTIYYRYWVEDNSVFEGRIATNIPSECEAESMIPTSQTFQKFTVRQNSINLKSVKVTVEDNITLQFPNGVNIIPVIYGQKFLNNQFLPDTDNVIFQGDATLITQKGENEIAVNALLSGSATRFSSYWLGFIIETEDELTELYLTNYCSAASFPHVDNYNETVAIESYSKGWKIEEEFGAAYDWNIEFPFTNLCNRTPVDIKLTCPPCDLPVPSATVDKTELKAGEFATVSTELLLTLVATNEEFDVFLFEGEITEDDYATLDISSAIFSQSAIKHGEKMDDFKIAYEDAGIYTMLFRDSKNPASTSCFKLEYITINQNNRSLEITGSETVCSSSDPEIITVKLTGTAPFIIEYTINDVVNTHTSTDNTAKILIPSDEVGTFLFEITAVEDGNGNFFDLTEEANKFTYEVFKTPVLFVSPRTLEIKCLEDDDLVSLAEFTYVVEPIDDEGTDVYLVAGMPLTSDLVLFGDIKQYKGLGDFQHTHTNSTGCTSSISFNIDYVDCQPESGYTVVDPDGNTIEPVADNVFEVCEGSEYTITYTPENGNIESSWESTPSKAGTVTSDHSFTIKDISQNTVLQHTAKDIVRNLEATQTISFKVIPMPLIDIGHNIVCEDAEPILISLHSDQGLTIYDEDDYFDPREAGPGIHKIPVTIEHEGCTFQSEIEIEVLALPEVSIDALPDVCAVEGGVIDIASALSPPINANSLTQVTSMQVSVNGSEVPLDYGIGQVDYVIDITYDYEDENGCTNSATGTLTTHYTPAVGYIYETGINVDPQGTLEGADHINDLVIVDGETGSLYEWVYEDGTLIGDNSSILDIESLGAPYIHQGAHVGYVTQILNGCESEKTKVEWFITGCTAPLAVEKPKKVYCEGAAVPTLTAESTDPTGYPTAEIFVDATDNSTQLSTNGSFTPADSDLIIGENVFYARVYDETADCWGVATPMVIVKNGSPLLSIENVEAAYCSSSSASIIFNTNGSILDTETITGIDTKNFDPASYTVTTDITIDWEVIDTKGCSGSTSATTRVTHVEPPVVSDAVWQLKEGSQPNTEMFINTDAGAFANYYFEGNDEGEVNSSFIPHGSYFNTDSDGNYVKQVQTFGFTQTIDGCMSEISTAEYVLTHCKLGKAVIKEIDPICEGEMLPSITAEFGTEGVDYYDPTNTVFIWKHGAVDVNEGPELDPTYLASLPPSTTPYQFTVYQFGPSIDGPHDECLSPPATVKFSHNPLPKPEFENLLRNVCINEEDVTLRLTSTNDVAKASQEFTASQGIIDLGSYLDLSTLTKETQVVDITGTLTGVNGCTASTEASITVHHIPTPELVDAYIETNELDETISFEVSNHIPISSSQYNWYSDEYLNEELYFGTQNKETGELEINTNNIQKGIYDFYIVRSQDITTLQRCKSSPAKAELTFEPTFDNEVNPGDDLTITINENPSVGDIIATLPETDKDGNPLTYTIPENDHFEIIDNTIVVKDNSGFDAEGDTELNIIVTINNGTDEETATISVGLEDINDLPVIELSDLSIDADAEQGTIIAELPLQDQDGDDISYTINNNNAVVLDGNKLIVGDLSEVDSESITVTVTADDGTATVEKEINIAINKTNQHAPELIMPTVLITIPENAENGTVVAKLTATDEDGDILMYGFTSDVEAFAIDSETGEITVKDASLINYNEKNKYELPIMVTDGEHILRGDIDIYISEEVVNAITSSDLELTVCPTLVTETVSIKAPYKGILMVINQQGSKIITEDFEEATTLDLSYLNAGIYTIHIRTKNKVAKGIIIKK